MNLWFNMRPAALVVCTPPKRGQGGRATRKHCSATAVAAAAAALAYLSRAHNFFRLSANQKAICRAGSHRGRESKIINIREELEAAGHLLYRKGHEVINVNASQTMEMITGGNDPLTLH